MTRRAAMAGGQLRDSPRHIVRFAAGIHENAGIEMRPAARESAAPRTREYFHASSGCGLREWRFAFEWPRPPSDGRGPRAAHCCTRRGRPGHLRVVQPDSGPAHEMQRLVVEQLGARPISRWRRAARSTGCAAGAAAPVPAASCHARPSAPGDPVCSSRPSETCGCAAKPHPALGRLEGRARRRQACTNSVTAWRAAMMSYSNLDFCGLQRTDSARSLAAPRPWPRAARAASVNNSDMATAGSNDERRMNHVAEIENPADRLSCGIHQQVGRVAVAVDGLTAKAAKPGQAMSERQRRLRRPIARTDRRFDVRAEFREFGQAPHVPGQAPRQATDERSPAVRGRHGPRVSPKLWSKAALGGEPRRTARPARSSARQVAKSIPSRVKRPTASPCWVGKSRGTGREGSCSAR